MQPMFGILGGMGPLATADFLRKFIENTPAKTDQDHIPTLVHNVPQIPDRTASILGAGPSPLPELLQGARFLVDSGASVIAMPCNTAHHWHRDLQAASPIPILHIVDSVHWALSRRNGSPVARVGLLATSGSLMAGFYQSRLAEHGVHCLVPEPDEQHRLVMAAVTLVKSGAVAQARALLLAAADRLIADGAQRVILGCTEIPIALADVPDAYHGLFLDATDALARCSVQWWTSRQHPAD